MKELFKVRLREARKKWGSLEALAIKVGTSYSTLQAWESSPPTGPDAFLLSDIAKVLGVSIQYLLTGEGPDPLPLSAEQELIQTQRKTIDLLNEKNKNLENDLNECRNELAKE